MVRVLCPSSILVLLETFVNVDSADFDVSLIMGPELLGADSTLLKCCRRKNSSILLSILYMHGNEELSNGKVSRNQTDANENTDLNLGEMGDVAKGLMALEPLGISGGLDGWIISDCDSMTDLPAF